jgi:hypothetical protein
MDGAHERGGSNIRGTYTPGKTGQGWELCIIKQSQAKGGLVDHYQFWFCEGF